MKNTYSIINMSTKISSARYMILAILLIFSLSPLMKVQAQSYCSPVKLNGGGFYTSIHRVIDNGGSYTITLRIEHNGCDDPDCKPLNQYSVQAEPGSYSNVYYEVVKGDVSINGINLGPNIAGWPYQGFRISSINGIGDGQAGVFYITYTLTHLQDQHCMAKAGDLQYEVLFVVDEFLEVINCPVQPYYLPPDGGKIGPNSKIGPELTALANAPGPYVSDDIFQIVDDTEVMIEAFPIQGSFQALLNLLQASYGLSNVLPDPSNKSIIGQIPIANLLSLNNVNELDYARPFYPVNMDIGEATTQGDQAMLSDVAKDIFKVSNNRSINGEGIMVGVLSNSFDSKGLAANDVDKFDLPGSPNHPYNTNPVVVLKDLGFEASDEGRAMMHIIHDVAPGARLAFHTGVLGAPDMAEGIRALAAAGCDVIVDDITYISEPFFEEGLVTQAISDVVNDPAGAYMQEVSYFTSAGNFGDKSYENTFVAGTSNTPGIYGTPHVFGTINGNEDIYNEISLPAGKYTFVLQWNDYSSFTETSVDLDIFLSNGEGSGFLGYNKDNTGELALEVLPFNITVPTTTNIVIVNTTGAPVEFKYVIFRGHNPTSVEYANGNSTITSHANSFDAITVGAVNYMNTPALGGTLSIEPFSSKGGPVSYINGEARPKPDIVAPDGVSTGVAGYESFYGTSAAAPHAAAVAALLQDASKTYNNHSLTAEEIRSILSSTALQGPTGVDNIYGYGFIQADAAIETLANPRSIITGIYTQPEDSVPGLHTIIVDVDGHYLINGGSVIYFNGQALPTNYGAGGTSLEATIQPFEELYPPIQVYNPPLNLNGPGLDGGFSDPVFFNEKPTIVGTIQNYTKYYGESLPAGGFTADYTIHYADGSVEPLTNANPYYQRITDIAIETGADDDTESMGGALAEIGDWPIFPSFNDPLNPLYTGSIDPNSVEAEILYNYSFRFEDGTMTIEKLDLTISPNDMEFTYGDDITGFSFSYDYNRDIIDDAVEVVLDQQIDDAYTGDMALNYAFMVDPESISGDLGDLTNKSFFISTDAYLEGQALALINAAVTGQALALINGQALALVNGQSLDQVAGQALALINGQSLNQVTGQALALVNAMDMVTGQALALVNGLSQTQSTGQALALVNAETLVQVPDIPEYWDEAYINGEALDLGTDFLTNGQSMTQATGQALALVNGTTINELSNLDAVIILTVEDIETATTTGTVELLSVNLITGNTVTNGNPHSIVPGAFNPANFNVSYGLGELTINPAQVNITGTHQVINQGEPEPDYTGYNFVYNGFVMGETESDVFGPAGPSYSTGYVNPPGDPGIYPVYLAPPSGNYTYSFPDPVNLYVNPDENGTKHVKPKLRCIEENGNGQFIAYFEYENANADYVYVPVGPENILTGDPGASWTFLSPQPELFQPGGSNGTAWEVLFNGVKITWTVSSQDHGHKSGVGSSASSTSSRCNKSAEATGQDQQSIEEAIFSKLYPNPAGDLLNIELEHPVTGEADIRVYDIYGKNCDVSLERQSDQHFRISLAGLPAGMYFVKARHSQGDEVLRFVKK